MDKKTLQKLINETIKTELNELFDGKFQKNPLGLKRPKKQKLVRLQKREGIPGKTRPWFEDDPVTIKQLEKAFKWFHLSYQKLGNGDYFKFTPRVPQDPWDPIEDDFTKRISLAGSIANAMSAIGNQLRDHVYAADIKGYGGDDVDTINLASNMKNCPRSPGNNYGPQFNIKNWIVWLAETDQLTDAEKKDEWLQRIIKSGYNAPPLKVAAPTPKELPKRLGNEFTACVPDAAETKEVWTTEPEIFIRVAYVDYNRQGKIEDLLDVDLFELPAKQQKAYISSDDLYLTAAGAKVFNAIKAEADEITYSR